MNETNESEVTDVEETVIVETTEEPQEETAEELKEKIKKLEIEKGIAQRERTKLAKEKAKLEAEHLKESKVTGELDNADYALLEVRGILEGDSRIDFIKEKMVKWNLPLRELLKDEDIQSKLKSMKIEGDVRAATPGSTRRAAATTSDNEDYWYQKYEATGKLPEVMPPGMAERLVNRKYAQADPRQNPFE